MKRKLQIALLALLLAASLVQISFLREITHRLNRIDYNTYHTYDEVANR